MVFILEKQLSQLFYNLISEETTVDKLDLFSLLYWGTTQVCLAVSIYPLEIHRILDDDASGAKSIAENSS